MLWVLVRSAFAKALLSSTTIYDFMEKQNKYQYFWAEKKCLIWSNGYVFVFATTFVFNYTIEMAYFFEKYMASLIQILMLVPKFVGNSFREVSLFDHAT